MTEKEFRRKWDKMLKCEDARAYKMIGELVPELFNLVKCKMGKKVTYDPIKKVLLYNR
jgi:hypothetical protein